MKVGVFKPGSVKTTETCKNSETWRISRLRHYISCLSRKDQGLAWQSDEEREQCHEFDFE